MEFYYSLASLIQDAISSIVGFSSLGNFSIYILVFEDFIYFLLRPTES